MKWKTLGKYSKLKKDDQVFFGRNKFGFFKGIKLVHATFPKGEAPVVAPFGSKKGSKYVELWDPNSGYGNNISTFIPKSKITKIRRVIK